MLKNSENNGTEEIGPPLLGIEKIDQVPKSVYSNQIRYLFSASLKSP